MRSAILYARLSPRDIGLFRFLLEAHENLALATTIDVNVAILKIRFAAESRSRVEATLAEIGKSVPVELLDAPFGSCQNG